MRLNAAEPIVKSDSVGVSVLTGAESCRYLGIRVGEQDTSAENWRLCMQATAARIALAVAKTHTVMQRVRIARAVILPKIIYVARHVWPDRNTLQVLHRTVKRFIWGARDGGARRAWIKEGLAELSIAEGGMSIPNVKSELTALSAKIVARWAAGDDPRARPARAILLGEGRSEPHYITPAHLAPATTPEYRQSIWQTGRSVLQAAHATAASQSVSNGMDKLADAVHRAVRRGKWSHEELLVSLGCDDQATATALVQAQQTAFGRASSDWIQLVDVAAQGALWTNGSVQVRAQHWDYCGGVRTLGELLQWRWIAPGEIAFRSVRRVYPLGNQHAAQFRRICTAVLVTYPRLLQRPEQRDCAVANSPRLLPETEWMIYTAGSGVRLSRNGNAQETSSTLQSMCKMDRFASSVQSSPSVQFPPIPTLSRLVQCWANTRRWRPSAKHYHTVVRARRRGRGVAERRLRQDNARITDPTITVALSVTWAELFKLKPAASVEIQTIFRLRHGALPRWSSPDRMCVHEGCDEPDPNTLTHWFWTCAVAKSV